MAKRLRLRHRLRLTLASVGASGVTLLVMFAAVWLQFRHAQVVAAIQTLDAALIQACQEIDERPLAPELGEVVHGNPGLSVASFQLNQQPIASSGPLFLAPRLGSGRSDFHGQECVYEGRRHGNQVVVAAVPWQGHDRDLRQLGLLLSFMWFASVTVVGLVTWTASRATFVPLEELSRQAEAMSGENLSGRLLKVGDVEYDLFAERLNRLLSRLEASAKREERFVADAAHELRTPLTVLRGQIETALVRPRTDAQYRETLLTLLDESERLSRMVELLLLSTTPKDQEVPPIDLEQVLERAHARWVDRFEPQGVELQLESEPATARILVTEMDVVIDNLLSNALTASPSGTKCTIRVRTEDAQSVVEVQDQGRGIPVELGESIFERFARLDNSRNRGSGGFGIGLAVCRRLVAHRSGKVSLAPSDHGALFVVRLPNGITPSDVARKTPIPAVASTNEK